jgi:hypothetical protein
MKTQVLWAAFALLGLVGCEGEEDRAPLTGSDHVPIAQEVRDYCTEHCAELTCEEERGTACRQNCESWLGFLDGACADSLRDTFDCQRELSCADLDAMFEEGREHEACGELIAAQVDACAPEEETAGCDTYCELAVDCNEELAPTCMDTCVLNQAWFEAHYGADCREALDAFWACEGGTTCEALEFLQTDNAVAPECRGLAQVADTECR